MKELFLAKKNKRNSGFSLVELVVAIGILAVISTIVAFMMTSSSKNYGRMSVETQLQSEAQLVANAISEYAIDSYNAENLCSETIDSAYDNTENKILVLHSLARDGVEYDYVIAKTTENKLYLGERKKPVGDSWTSFEFSLLGNYISDFTVDTSHVEKENIIDFKLTYTKNNRSYTGNYQVLMRNRAYADKDPQNELDKSPLKVAFGLQPKHVYIDIIDGKPGVHYYVNEISSGGERNLNNKQIEFTASVTSNKLLENEDVEWYINGADENCFSLPEAVEDANGKKTLSKTATLTIKDMADFKGSAIDDFTISVSKSLTDDEGNTVSAKSKQSKVHLRRVKSITIHPISGFTSWKSEFKDIGTSSSEARSYAVPNLHGLYQPMVLRANVIHKWVPNAGGLTWKIEMRDIGDPVGSWKDSTSDFATLQYAETKNSTINTVNFGANAQNGQLYKVTATSMFDSSVYATYILGVAPKDGSSQDGFNSRGFYVSLKDFAKFYADDLASAKDKLNYGGSADVLKDFKNGNFKTVVKGTDDDDDGFENASLEQINGEWYVYLDYDSFQYTKGEAIDFFKGCGQYKITITTTPSDPNQTICLYYWFAPVFVHRNAPGQDFLVIRRGQSRDVRIQTDYYNIIGEKYFGIYVKNNISDKDFGTNLAGSNFDLNPYLTCTVQNSYGDVKTYVDTMRVSLKMKDPLVYNPEPMVARFTAEEYYKLCDESQKTRTDGITSQHYNKTFSTAPCTDITVFMANVINQDVYIPCPKTTATYEVGSGKTPTTKSYYPLTEVNRTNCPKIDIKVYKADGTVGTAKTYKSGSQYKCDYAGNTYTFNPTYYYWYN